MQPTEARFACSTDITAEVIDGEAIIINLSDGTYYSTDGVGACIWEMLAAKAHLADIVERIVARYEVGPERARADVDGFVSGLSREKLIAPAEVGAAAETPTEPDLGDDRLPYARPELHSYRDMADLLALDPPTPGALDHLMRGSGEGPRH